MCEQILHVVQHLIDLLGDAQRLSTGRRHIVGFTRGRGGCRSTADLARIHQRNVSIDVLRITIGYPLDFFIGRVFALDEQRRADEQKARCETDGYQRWFLIGTESRTGFLVSISNDQLFECVILTLEDLKGRKRYIRISSAKPYAIVRVSADHFESVSLSEQYRTTVSSIVILVRIV